ncbi:MAG TPA: hypothetical protein VFV67_15965 [Actinophytocola sp.]|uniref:hypothetical protein n=1 Tax=Actinophytocola sp. TaxID=1872138 RepID=UPI002DBCB739|nr:hypothetical protein [Actinophytocola sp.]HEU5472149.1 hypothetical protein [Actinophytocola sp.]
MTSRRPMLPVAAAALTITLAGCAQAVPGTAQPDQVAAAKAMESAYTKGISEFQTHFGRLGDERAKVYNYLYLGDSKHINEFESAKFGNPPMTVVVKHPGADDKDVQIFLHTPNSDVDLVKLDSRHAALAPTPWVSTPTFQLKDGFDPYLMLTSWVAVKLDGAITQTKLDAPDQQRRSVTPKQGGGYELRTGVTLESMIDGGIASVPVALRDKVTAEMKATVLPVRMDFEPDWRFRGFEVLGTVPGDPQLRIQLGYEVTGRASREDFPQPPAPQEITAITDKDAVAKFYDDLGDADG